MKNKFKRLENFKHIFNRDDFNYISNTNNIENISRILKNQLLYVDTIKEFYANLKSFYEWVGDVNENIRKGCALCQEQLLQIIRIFEALKIKKIRVSRKYFKKFNKFFLLGLSKIYDGVKKMFDPDAISKTRITKTQLINYVLDINEGLGKRFKYNKKGKHAFANKIYSLDENELITTLRLLVKSQKNQIRHINKWDDLGESKCLVRILKIKNKVYFLYRLNEHKDYEDQLMVRPEKVQFVS